MRIDVNSLFAEGTEPLMFNYIFALVRFCLLLAVAAISFVVVLFVPLLNYQQRAKIVKNWAIVTLKTVGMHREYLTATSENYFARNTMVIANHFSWLDVAVLYTLYCINFVGKTEMQKWPFLNRLIRAGGTIFINRSNKRDILKVNQTISEELIAGKCIGLFPEGSVNDGHKILPFKSSILEAAILAQSTIIPVVLIYRYKNGKIAYPMSYARQNFYQNVINSLKCNGFKTTIIELPAVNAGNFGCRRELSEYLYHLMSEEYKKHL